MRDVCWRGPPTPSAPAAKTYPAKTGKRKQEIITDLVLLDNKKSLPPAPKDASSQIIPTTSIMSFFPVPLFGTGPLWYTALYRFLAFAL